MVKPGISKVFHQPLKSLGMEHAESIKYALELENCALKITLLKTAFKFHMKTDLQNILPFRWFIASRVRYYGQDKQFHFEFLDFIS